MGQFTCRHVFDTNVETYWDKIFFDEGYNLGLFREELGFGYEVLELTKEADGTVRRKVRTTPKSDAPTAVKKLIGDGLSYLEEGRFDPVKRRWLYTITPSKLADKISIKGELWAEPKGDKLERIATLDLEVKIFGVGKIVESFIEKTTRDSYDKAAAFTNRFVREKKL